MGKISKALEKIEKLNPAKPVEQPVAKRMKSKKESVRARSSDKPVNPPEKRRPTGHAPQASEPAGLPLDKPPRRSSDYMSMPDTVAGVDAGDDAAFEPDSTQQVENRSDIKDRSIEEQPPSGSAPAAKTPSNQVHNDSAKPDGANISLVKPEMSQPFRTVRQLVAEKPAAASHGSAGQAAKPALTKKVRVNYSKTKIQLNDPEKLLNNRVFSILDDLETTEQVKILRTQVLRKLKAMGGNSILVTSANPYEGKTFTSINLGVSIAKEFDRTVLIIDADIRKPTLQHTAFSTGFFSLDVEKGLTDYLMDEADISDILINPGIEKLTLIPGGKPVFNSSELLNSAKMAEMMSEIKSRYPSDRIVIVDGPALLPFSDAMILSRYVDGVLPVVEAEKTSSEDLKKMMAHLKEVTLLGFVLNKNKE